MVCVDRIDRAQLIADLQQLAATDDAAALAAARRVAAAIGDSSYSWDELLPANIAPAMAAGSMAAGSMAAGLMANGPVGEVLESGKLIDAAGTSMQLLAQLRAHPDLASATHEELDAIAEDAAANGGILDAMDEDYIHALAKRL